MSKRLHVERLDSGVTVALAEMPHMASVSLGVWFGVGGRYEAAAVNGASHFIEHMLFKGTRRRSAQAISQEVEGVGGYLNAFTAEEMSCIDARARADHVELLMDVMGDMVARSRFDAADIEKERTVIRDEVAMVLDQPQQRVQEMLNELVWPNHPLGRPLTGTLESLERLDRDALLAHLRRHYVAENTCLVAAGRITWRRWKAIATRLASLLPRGTPPPFEPVAEAQDRPRVSLLRRDTEQAHLDLGIRVCSRHDRRRFALRLLNTMLGENMSSRLFQIIREDRGLAYSIESSTSLYADTGLLVISAGLDPSNLNPVLKLVMAELRRSAKEAPGRSELRRAKDYVLGQIDLNLEATEQQMIWLGEQLLGHGRATAPDGMKRALAAVTAAEVQSAARDFFRPDRLNLALVSPHSSNRELQRLLKLS